MVTAKMVTLGVALFSNWNVLTCTINNVMKCKYITEVTDEGQIGQTSSCTVLKLHLDHNTMQHNT